MKCNKIRSLILILLLQCCPSFGKKILNESGFRNNFRLYSINLSWKVCVEGANNFTVFKKHFSNNKVYG